MNIGARADMSLDPGSGYPGRWQERPLVHMASANDALLDCELHGGRSWRLTS